MQTENLPGMIFDVDDERYWGIENSPRPHHPGACYGLNKARTDAWMAKGSSQAKNARYKDAYVEVLPTIGNGLTDTTYFSVREEYCFPIAIMGTLFNASYRGKLSESDLIAIQEAVSYAFRYDGSDEK